MADLLIVASPTVRPLSTDRPVSTDGQPLWDRCERCGWRRRPYQMDAPHCVQGKSHAMVPDGPFPFTVARWSEGRLCQGRAVSEERCPFDGSAHDKVGAIVELVEVTGPSHHTVRGVCNPAAGLASQARCTDERIPDGWHTPTGKVMHLSEPVPCERPAEAVAIADDLSTLAVSETSLWWADETVVTQLREVTA